MLETTIEKWKQQGVEEGRREGRQEGRQEGLEQAKIAFATKLLQRGDSVDEVAEVTELPVKTVQQLADEINS